MSDKASATPRPPPPPLKGKGNLEERLRENIRLNGPISVADFMQACLHDPEHGYYATRPALGGEDADFLTAPEASQMFGELLGLWCAHEWTQIGSPAPVQLIELGPGRGVLMQDALRAAQKAPSFFDALKPTFVESSAPLRAEQRARVAHAQWAARLEDAPPGPALILANEFLDCLPIRQFARAPEGWREKLLGLDANGALRFGLSEPMPGLAFDTPLDFIETMPALAPVIGSIAERLHAYPGRALLIDYGYDAPEGADTLQALQRHQKVEPLACPGEADLTAHVDFSAVKRLGEQAGLQVHGPIGQGQLLRTLGLDQRAEALARAHPERLERLKREHARLTAPDQMGVLFKAICLSSPKLSPPAGF